MEPDEIIQVRRGEPDPEELAALAVVLLGVAAEQGASAADADVTTLPTWRRRDPAVRPAPRSWAA